MELWCLMCRGMVVAMVQPEERVTTVSVLFMSCTENRRYGVRNDEVTATAM